jgi:large subunit ribosomal protein L19
MATETTTVAEEVKAEGAEQTAAAEAKKTIEFDANMNIIPAKKDFPEFKAGDTITVHYKIIEGDKQRIQNFKGDVIQRKGTGNTQTFTVRKVSNGIGVERIFPLYSPNIDKIEVNKKGKVRKARLYYMIGRKGKQARIKEKKAAHTTDKKA